MVFLIAPQHFNLLRCTLIRDVYEFLLKEFIKIVFFNFQIRKNGFKIVRQFKKIFRFCWNRVNTTCV